RTRGYCSYRPTNGRLVDGVGEGLYDVLERLTPLRIVIHPERTRGTRPVHHDEDADIACSRVAAESDDILVGRALLDGALKWNGGIGGHGTARLTPQRIARAVEADNFDAHSRQHEDIDRRGDARHACSVDRGYNPVRDARERFVVGRRVEGRSLREQAVHEP